MARDHTPRGLRDEASVGPDPRRARELKRLSELKFRVADGEPDIVGWAVFASTGREVGKVTDLLVDVDAGEVVMLDIDLRRGDQHTLAPVRAAWIDHAARRVVLDARELEQNDELLPGLPRSGTLSDDQVRRFNDDYVRAYGDRGVERDTDWRVRHGDEELRFGVEPRADLQAAPRRDDRLLGTAGAAGAAAAGAAAGPHFEESQRIDAIMEGRPVARERERNLDLDRAADAHHVGEPRRLLDHDAPPAAPLAAPLAASHAAAVDADRDRLDRDRLDRDRLDRDRLERERLERDRLDTDRRLDRTDDASALHPSGAIDPRELDARVRIDEGGTVDDRTPVGGVRYEGAPPAPHDYGRPDERYGPEYGSGRIGFDRVVSRHPLASDDPADAPRRLDDAGDRTLERMPADPRQVRYRRYDDPPPSDVRR